jgi:hypothetical protein
MNFVPVLFLGIMAGTTPAMTAKMDSGTRPGLVA